MIGNDYDSFFGRLLIKKAKLEKWKVCVYGLGLLGSGAGLLFPDYLGLSTDYYCDKDKNVLYSFNVDEDKKITVLELLRIKHSTLVLLFVGLKIIKDVKKELSKNKNLFFYTFQEMTDNDEIIKKYFELDRDIPYFRETFDANKYDFISNMKTNRIAIFTCVLDDYDPINEPMSIENDCDYYLISDKTDNETRSNTVYSVININSIVPNDIDSAKDRNRYCKMHGFSIFKEYDYSIYVDGSLQIIGEISKLINSIGQYGLGFFSHVSVFDSYMEALSLSVRSRIKHSEAISTIQMFVNNNFPRHFGSIEGGLIVCDNRNIIAQKILEKWYEEYMTGEAKRDQLYLPYVLFKLGMSISDINVYKGDMRDSGFVRQIHTHTGYQK